ncbi:hypothetical protein K435DRAFT_879835, partial [Dendrothele bispora CBS 962.96]
MLVDNPISSNPFSSPSDNSYADISDYLNTDLFAPSTTTTATTTNAVSSTTPGSPGASGSASTSSRASSPSILSTPPQDPSQTSFPPPDVADPFSFLNTTGPSSTNGFGGFGFGTGSGTSSFFNFLDDEYKMDPMGMGGGMSYGGSGVGGGAPYDFLSASSSSAATNAMNMDVLNALFQPNLSSTTTTVPTSNPSSSASLPAHMSIDPHLVDSPSTAPQSEFGEPSEEDEMADVVVVASSPTTTTTTTTKKPSKSEQPEEKLTLTIAPVKVGGHGKARKGTVQSGGVTKKVASSTATTTTTTASTTSSASIPTPSSKNKENHSTAKKGVNGSEKGEDEDDDDLPADWRPPPEVFAKMTSKEKRQLRNKISARNFRVRRKEYITTLETDIAERDRLLDAIRSELGTTQSENLALRQEIAALKKALLGNRPSSSSPSHPSSAATSLLTPVSPLSAAGTSLRGADVNLNSTAVVTVDDLHLPPPAPLPERSAAEELAARAAAAELLASSSSPSTSGDKNNNANAHAQVSGSSSLLTPNTHKDLPTSPQLGGASFWGGVSQAGFGAAGSSSLGGLGFGNGFGGGGGYTQVHRVLMPDLDLGTSVARWVRDVVSANQQAQQQGQQQQQGEKGERRLQENMNPILN